MNNPYAEPLTLRRYKAWVRMPGLGWREVFVTVPTGKNPTEEIMRRHRCDKWAVSPPTPVSLVQGW